MSRAVDIEDLKATAQRAPPGQVSPDADDGARTLRDQTWPPGSARDVPLAKTRRDRGCYVALDVGEVRLGVARLDDGVATPLQTLERKGTKRDIEALRALLAAAGVAGAPAAAIVGLPPEGADPRSCAARRAREFARRLAVATGWPTVLVDESDSTAIARERLGALGLRAGGLRSHLDAWAAAEIARRYAGGAAAEPWPPADDDGSRGVEATLAPPRLAGDAEGG